MHSFQNFIVRLIINHPPPLETRIWKLIVRALHVSVCITWFLILVAARFTAAGTTGNQSGINAH